MLIKIRCGIITAKQLYHTEAVDKVNQERQKNNIENMQGSPVQGELAPQGV